MTTPKKPTQGVDVKPLENFLPLYTKNVEKLAELQKKALEVVAEQNAEFIDTCKKTFNFLPETPGLFWFDLLGQTFERAIETQKGAIDLAVEQSKAVSKLAEERTGSAGKVTEGATALFEQALQQTVAAQKKGIEYCAEQYKTAYETAKKQFKFSNPVAETFQTGLDLLLETQKSLLDIATKPLKRAAAA